MDGFYSNKYYCILKNKIETGNVAEVVLLVQGFKKITCFSFVVIHIHTELKLQVITSRKN